MQRESDPRDQRILEITKQPCQEIGIYDYNPTFVSWETYDSRVRRRPWDHPVQFAVDDCLIERYCVTLSAKMREVLEPEEWRPIIASGLIFSKKLRTRILAILLLAILGFGTLDLFVYFTLSMLFPQVITYTGRSGACCYTTTLGGVIGFPLAIAILVLGTVISTALFARRTRLLADRMAADIVGREAFLYTLNKINEAMNQRVKRRGPLPFLPEIGSRMKKLELF